jgi:hypothetical protein
LPQLTPARRQPTKPYPTLPNSRHLVQCWVYLSIVGLMVSPHR